MRRPFRSGGQRRLDRDTQRGRLTGAAFYNGRGAGGIDGAGGKGHGRIRGNNGIFVARLLGRRFGCNFGHKFRRSNYVLRNRGGFGRHFDRFDGSGLILGGLMTVIEQIVVDLGFVLRR
jgi:hypothetical protein